MSGLELIGLRISVYTRIARLALEEKRIDYQLTEVDIFADDGPPAHYLEHHPFGTIPCLRHDEFYLYETGAITRYADEAFIGPALQPSKPMERARQNQIISVLDAYAYRPMVWDVYVQRIVVPEGGGQSDESTISAGLSLSGIVLKQLDAWCGDNDFLVGNTITLADLHAYPMLLYFSQTDEGDNLLHTTPRMRQWLERMEVRPSTRATQFHGD